MNLIVPSHRLLRGTSAAGMARRLTAAMALTGLVLAVSACGSSSSTGTTTTASAGSTSSGASSTSSTTTTSAPPSSGASLSKFGSLLSTGEDATFVAVYHVSGESEGKAISGTLTISHDGASSLFGISVPTGAFEGIQASGKTTICAKTSGKWACYGGALGQEFGTSLDPFENLYSAKAQDAELKAEESGAYDVSQSSKTIAGQSLNCITYHSHTDSGVFTICVTSQGVMGEVNGQDTSGHWTLTLSSFSTSVPSNEFVLPATLTSP